METILHGSVGLLTARSGGHLVSLQCYVSPYDIFEEGSGMQLNFTDANSENVFQSEMMEKLIYIVNQSCFHLSFVFCSSSYFRCECIGDCRGHLIGL